MKRSVAWVCTLLAGGAMGAATVHVLHAQATPPAYVIAEIDVTDVKGYLQDYAPRAQANIKAAGGRYLAVGTKANSILGEPPKRIVVIAWDSMEAVLAWQNSQEFANVRQVGDRYAKFRVIAVEGMSK